MKASIRWTAQRAAAVLDSVPGSKLGRGSISSSVRGTQLSAGTSRGGGGSLAGRGKRDVGVGPPSALSPSSSLSSSSSSSVEEATFVDRHHGTSRGKRAIKTLGLARRGVGVHGGVTCQLPRRVANSTCLMDEARGNDGLWTSIPSSLAAQTLRRSYRNWATCHYTADCALPAAAASERRLGGSGPRGVPLCHVSSYCRASTTRSHAATSATSATEAIEADHSNNVPVEEGSEAALSASSSAASSAVDRPTWHAHIDFKYVRDKRDKVLANVRARDSTADVDKVVALYEEFSSKTQVINELRQQRNAVANEMKTIQEEGKRLELVEQGKLLKDQLAALEAELSKITDDLQREGQKIPNSTHPEVPPGGEGCATLRRMVGLKPDFQFKPKDHVELAKELDLIDFDSAAEVSGQKFYYLKNEAVLLEAALINWSMSHLVGRGFTPLSTPDLVRSAVVEKCGFQPRASNTQVYSVEGMDLCLAGTAEIPVGGMFMDKILSDAELPLKLVAFSHCFRTEAGAPGAASRGLYRVHQFSKAEMFAICRPEESEEMHEELITIEEEMFTSLGLHFKTLDMPSEDLGAPAYRKFDVEAWMPGLCRYGEISSASNCTDYQARRLNIRYRPAVVDSTLEEPLSEATVEGQAQPADDANNSGSSSSSNSKKRSPKKKSARRLSPRFVHTLNATACAVPRMIIAILETFQQEDGSVLIPEPLHPYMGGRTIIRPKAEGRGGSR
ncbi:hypothetical protein CBR_g10918 [Chara braunii]|uniref:serine--tRNA ligase n=1 Tax=Chara braunii TaxID=69332 RepID=A0A388KPI7_CHABU|nr:hypothetical protein CBR_g10918 [Chara braunii]|eukprot:GBG71980.1 hypothetical protein CBR_g10918 [Chara braunii]